MRQWLEACTATAEGRGPWIMSTADVSMEGFSISHFRSCTDWTAFYRSKMPGGQDVLRLRRLRQRQPIGNLPVVAAPWEAKDSMFFSKWLKSFNFKKWSEVPLTEISKLDPFLKDLLRSCRRKCWRLFGFECWREKTAATWGKESKSSLITCRNWELYVSEWFSSGGFMAVHMVVNGWSNVGRPPSGGKIKWPVFRKRRTGSL